MIGLVIYASSWLVFAVFHSMLARQVVQARLEAFLGSYYRLAYNLLAVLKISLVLAIGKIWLSNNRYPFFESKIALVTSFGTYVLGFIVLLVALAVYDLGRFSGITQIITGERISSLSNEPLQRRYLNRWVRHPLYTGAFLILWGGANSSLGLWTAVFGTIYLIIGTSFEERKLMRIYGDEYSVYQQEVPKYFPSFIRIIQ